MKTPANLGAAFVRSTKPQANCRLERATYEMAAGSGSPFVRRVVEVSCDLIFFTYKFKRSLYSFFCIL